MKNAEQARGHEMLMIATPPPEEDQIWGDFERTVAEHPLWRFKMVCNPERETPPAFRFTRMCVPTAVIMLGVHGAMQIKVERSEEVLDKNTYIRRKKKAWRWVCRGTLMTVEWFNMTTLSRITDTQSDVQHAPLPWWVWFPEGIATDGRLLLRLRPGAMLDYRIEKSDVELVKNCAESQGMRIQAICVH